MGGEKQVVQRIDLGLKIQTYPKFAIVQYDKKSAPLSKHWATLHMLFSLMSLITTSMGHCVMDGWSCWSSLSQRDVVWGRTVEPRQILQLTTSSARQIGTCSVEMAFETSTTKNLFLCAVIST
nr:hypothetical protein CFP56_40784 [Quercus suber]